MGASPKFFASPCRGCGLDSYKKSGLCLMCYEAAMASESLSLDLLRQKLGEEAFEVVLAGSPDELLAESADLIRWLTALLAKQGLSLQDALRAALQPK